MIGDLGLMLRHSLSKHIYICKYRPNLWQSIELDLRNFYYLIVTGPRRNLVGSESEYLLIFNNLSLALRPGFHYVIRMNNHGRIVKP